MDSNTLDLIRRALQEDLGDIGDLTARYFVPPDAMSLGRMVAREPCVLAGVEVAVAVFLEVDPTLEASILQSSGNTLVEADLDGSPILEVRGSTRSILTAERTALNFAQRLSGVATMTHYFVKAVEGTGAIILDTRKTTPGLRRLQKEAVRHGGGQNHRMGLFDRVMVKDNHLANEDRATALQAAIDRLHADYPTVEVELEADTLEQVDQFLKLRGVNYILLDNMSPGAMRQAVAQAKGSGIALEASGNINLDTVAEVASTGVDYISVGAITHSARSVDLSLELHKLSE